MHTDEKALQRLQSEIKFRNMVEAQIRESEFAASEAIYELFEPYLEKIREKISRTNRELTIQAWIENEPTRMVPESSSDIQTNIAIVFHWEPLKNGLNYIPAMFTDKQSKFVFSVIESFEKAIGYNVYVLNEV
jgi:hypothetical protein